jgi:hypothetical protein
VKTGNDYTFTIRRGKIGGQRRKITADCETFPTLAKARKHAQGVLDALGHPAEVGSGVARESVEILRGFTIPAASTSSREVRRPLRRRRDDFAGIRSYRRAVAVATGKACRDGARFISRPDTVTQAR